LLKFVTSIHINQPPDIVNQAYTNPENMICWTRHLERFEVVRGSIAEPGALARLHFRKKGRAHTMEDELLETEPGRRYKSRVSGQGITAVVETFIEPVDEGTRITLQWNGRTKSPAANLILYLLRGRIRREARSELSEFKKLVESRGVNFSTG
jgi:uncharacterized protein YndB with AHSA1/START domain